MSKTNQIICPNCYSDKYSDRTGIYKEPRTPVYDYACEECNCLFNDEDDFVLQRNLAESPRLQSLG